MQVVYTEAANFLFEFLHYIHKPRCPFVNEFSGTLTPAGTRGTSPGKC